jgi:hypothetical protein
MSSSEFTRVRAALEAVGQAGEWDEDLETVTYDDGAGRSTVGVVLPAFGAVTFYSVWPEQVPAEAAGAVTEFVARANTDLHTAALEFDLDKLILSARSGVLLIPFEGVDPEVFGVVLAGARTDADRVASTHHSAVAALFLGTSALDALQMRLD